MAQYYTDGSAVPNPGQGGYAVIKNGIPYLIGGELKSTNIRMEGRALLEALKDAQGSPCEIITDCEFWVKTLKEYAPNWEARGWQKKGGIANLELVKELYYTYKESQATLTWVKGHSTDPLNALADHWAKFASREGLTEPKLL